MGTRTAESKQGVSGRWPTQALYVLMETPCPYLPGRRERKLMTEIREPGARESYSRLSRAGFRRSHNFAYRPACSGCSACTPVRVRVADFVPSRSQRRIQRLNRDLLVEDRPARADREQFSLFSRYVKARHGEGDMAAMGFSDYRTMVEETRLETSVTEFRDQDGGLVAACLTDWLEDGPSAVYSFFEPTLSRRSLGNYMVLWLIEAACQRKLPHLYLGYWIENSSKMSYKIQFHPVEGLRAGGWEILSG